MVNPDDVADGQQLQRPVAVAASSDMPRFALPLPVFEGSFEQFPIWFVRFSSCVRLNRVTDDSDKRAMLICSLSPSVQETLMALCGPADVCSVEFDVLLAKLKSHYSVMRNELLEYFKLFYREPPAGMGYEDFAAEVRELALNCTWPLTRDRALAVAFTLGVKSMDLKAELLLENYASLEPALEHAKRFEAASIRTWSRTRDRALVMAFTLGLRDEDLKAELLRANYESFDDAVEHAKRFEAEKLRTNRWSSSELSDSDDNHSRKGDNNPTSSSCNGCGRSDHTRAACPFKNVFCRACGKKAHIAKVCRSKPSNRYRP